MLIKCSKNERVKKLQSLSPDVIAAVALGVSLNLKMNDTIDSVRINDWKKSNHVVLTFAVPELTSGQLSAAFNPTRPALERILAEFGSVAVPVDRHEIDGVLVRSAWAQNGRTKQSEVKLSLKQRDRFLQVTAASKQRAQLRKEIWHIQQIMGKYLDGWLL